MPTSEPLPPAPPELERFRLLVLGDESLQEELRALTDQKEFIERVVRLGEVWGCRFTAAEVEEALWAARRSWLERWVV
jgi:hypothetical protein